MEGTIKKKGTVTSLSSLFPPEETQKALDRVQNAILDRRKNLDQLKEFIAENTNLINVVQTLPNELHHDIMVPFGKAAFFPGQLIHTNEIMVLLGESYYAERTSRQTVEILKRRAKTLDSQVEALKAEIEDLKVEASFFDATAAEAKDGLVQIVEDYAEETSAHGVTGPSYSETDSSKAFKAENSGDEEFDRIFSRMDELEKEEEEAENAIEDEGMENEDDFSFSKLQLSEEVKSSEVDGLNLLSVREDESSHDVAPISNFKPNLPEKAWELPRIKETVEAPTLVENEVVAFPSEPPKSDTNSRKSFTGSIVEHTHNLESNPMEPSSVRSSKPVSRFKLRRQ